MGLLAFCISQAPPHELALYLGLHPALQGWGLRTPSTFQTHCDQAPSPRAQKGEGWNQHLLRVSGSGFQP